MKLNYLAISLLAAAGLLVSACGESKSKTSAEAANVASSTAAPVITADSPFEKKTSYAIGASVGTYINAIQKEQAQFIGELDQDLIRQGFLDALDNKAALDESQITQILVELDEKVRKSLEQKQQEENAKNLELGKKFLEENAKKEGVVVTDSGLQYQVIKEGTGKTPSISDIVRVKYKGTTIDGTVFDEQQEEPVAFPLSSIIPGWTEGLQLMKEGGQIKLFIPSELAYGETGAGQIIAPNSTLIFEVELVEVVPADEAKEAAEAATAGSSEAASTEKAAN